MYLPAGSKMQSKRDWHILRGFQHISRELKMLLYYYLSFHHKCVLSMRCLFFGVYLQMIYYVSPESSVSKQYKPIYHHGQLLLPPDYFLRITSSGLGHPSHPHLLTQRQRYREHRCRFSSIIALQAPKMLIFSLPWWVGTMMLCVFDSSWNI